MVVKNTFCPKPFSFFFWYNTPLKKKKNCWSKIKLTTAETPSSDDLVTDWNLGDRDYSLHLCFVVSSQPLTAFFTCINANKCLFINTKNKIPSPPTPPPQKYRPSPITQHLLDKSDLASPFFYNSIVGFAPPCSFCPRMFIARV